MASSQSDALNMSSSQTDPANIFSQTDSDWAQDEHTKYTDNSCNNFLGDCDERSRVTPYHWHAFTTSKLDKRVADSPPDSLLRMHDGKMIV